METVDDYYLDEIFSEALVDEEIEKSIILLQQDFQKLYDIALLDYKKKGYPIKVNIIIHDIQIALIYSNLYKLELKPMDTCRYTFSESEIANARERIGNLRLTDSIFNKLATEFETRYIELHGILIDKSFETGTMPDGDDAVNLLDRLIVERGIQDIISKQN